MTTTAEFLAEQKRLAEAATPGPWRLGSFGHGPNAIVRDAEGLSTVQDVWVCDADAGRPENAEFIAAARSSVPKLIAAVEAVMAEHRPVDVEPSETVCHGCSTLRGTGENARYFPYEEWPCPTIRAIEAALGGEGE